MMMPTAGGGGGGGGEHQQPQSPGPASPSTRLMRTPKEGERILAPTRRPDGTLRKPVRIRAGYVPQDEVAIYQSKGALLKKGIQPETPPGYDPSSTDNKPKTKSAKRNEKRKEKKHQAALASANEQEQALDSEQAEVMKIPEHSTSASTQMASVESLGEQMNTLSVLETSEGSPSKDGMGGAVPEAFGPDNDKKIRALKKKIRQAEALLDCDQQNMKPEQLEKMAKLESWRRELKLLEDGKVALTS